MKAIIFFTRVPIAGKTKTRMQPYLSPDECAILHKAMIKDIYKECSKTPADIFVYYTPLEGLERLQKIIGTKHAYKLQNGEHLVEKYGNSDVFANTLKKLSNLGLKIAYTKTLYDIDTKDDLALHRQRLRKYAERHSKHYKELQKRNLGKFALDKVKISIIIPI